MGSPTDKASDYFCLRPEHESYLVAHPEVMRRYGRNPIAPFEHRLGRFYAMGVGKRAYAPAYPRVVNLHVAVWAKPFIKGNDPTAEEIAAYLANFPENIPGSPWWKEPAPGTVPSFRIASAHAACDIDSRIQMLPGDGIAWTCGNPFTAAESWEIEMRGLGTENADYWRSEQGTSILYQSAMALIESMRLSFGEDWEKAIPPMQKAVFNENGSVKVPGFSQHREVPYAMYRSGRFLGWAQYPENLKWGQHADVGADFPFDHYWDILKACIIQVKS